MSGRMWANGPTAARVRDCRASRDQREAVFTVHAIADGGALQARAWFCAGPANPMTVGPSMTTPGWMSRSADRGVHVHVGGRGDHAATPAAITSSFLFWRTRFPTSASSVRLVDAHDHVLVLRVNRFNHSGPGGDRCPPGRSRTPLSVLRGDRSQGVEQMRQIEGVDAGAGFHARSAESIALLDYLRYSSAPTPLLAVTGRPFDRRGDDRAPTNRQSCVVLDQIA